MQTGVSYVGVGAGASKLDSNRYDDLPGKGEVIQERFHPPPYFKFFDGDSGDGSSTNTRENNPSSSSSSSSSSNSFSPNSFSSNRPVPLLLNSNSESDKPAPRPIFQRASSPKPSVIYDTSFLFPTPNPPVKTVKQPSAVQIFATTSSQFVDDKVPQMDPGKSPDGLYGSPYTSYNPPETQGYYPEKGPSSLYDSLYTSYNPPMKNSSGVSGPAYPPNPPPLPSPYENPTTVPSKPSTQKSHISKTMKGDKPNVQNYEQGGYSYFGPQLYGGQEVIRDQKPDDHQINNGEDEGGHNGGDYIHDDHFGSDDHSDGHKNNDEHNNSDDQNGDDDDEHNGDDQNSDDHNNDDHNSDDHNNGDHHNDSDGDDIGDSNEGNSPDDHDSTEDLSPPPHYPHLPKYVEKDPYQYNFYHHHPHVYHQVTTTTTTEAPKEDKRVNTAHYSYYYLGRKLWYIPLYFSVYFIVYITLLILKSIARHKVSLVHTYPLQSRSLDDNQSYSDYLYKIDSAQEKYAM